MPDIPSMVIKLPGLLKSCASDILAGFVIGTMSLSLIGPAIAEADVSPAVPPDATLIALQAAAAQNDAKPFGTLPKAEGVTTPRKTLKVEVTAYTSRAEETDSTPFTTANGTRVHDGVLATNLLPFGTKVRIPALSGDKVYTVEDRMNSRYQNNVDIWTDDVNVARQIGRRNVMIEVF